MKTREMKLGRQKYNVKIFYDDHGTFDKINGSKI